MQSLLWPSGLVKGYHPLDGLPADGAGGLGQGLVAAVAATHMPTVQQHAAAGLAQANHAGVLQGLIPRKFFL